MNCLNPRIPDLQQFLCAIDLNAGVRPFDQLMLAVSIMSLIATIGIAVVVAIGSKRQGIRERRLAGMNYALAQIDLLRFEAESDRNDLSSEFTIATEKILNGLQIHLGRSDRNLLVLMRGEFDYAQAERIPGNATVPDIMQELKSDLVRDLSNYMTSATYQRKLKRFIASIKAPARFQILDWIDFKSSSNQSGA
ncbi:hypothetical protein [Cryobacterium sp. TMS1-13-1]|uniref:hypothetical protein n=1 Tax=Cryobacterium sp. TMS1-13-1 TaxID=1259220 RepID=UPI00106C69E9|nr:hypothetical protein [Cryobacterium sp. TMS1-13-1]TFD19200.1 hypothetical protein E3T31_16595 [Cryobacterium sp. TMS1-13-1]